MKIISLNSFQILDSRGNPTLEVEIVLDDGSKGVFQVPSGASTGIHEACELRDHEQNFYHGNSVLKAVDNVKKLEKELIGKDLTQRKLDELLISIDGSENKEVYGANALLGVSVAFAKASAKYYNLPLYSYLYCLANKKNNFGSVTRKPSQSPRLFANVLNGGLHAGNKLNIQEFMLIPNLFSLKDNVRAVSEIYFYLKQLISKKYGKENTGVGDEGGFAPAISSAKEALDLLTQAVELAGYEGEVYFALDAAASDFYDSKSKIYEVEEKVKLDFKQLSKYYSDLVSKYPIISIEDPFSEDDFEAFSFFMKNLPKLKFKNPLNDSNEILVVGDDLLVTNPKRIELASQKKLCNSLLLKINQIGTVTESLDAFNLSKKNGWHTIVSHRSGETTDDFISDLSVSLNSSIKLGACARGERVAKYNRLLKIYNDYNF